MGCILSTLCCCCYPRCSPCCSPCCKGEGHSTTGTANDPPKYQQHHGDAKGPAHAPPPPTVRPTAHDKNPYSGSSDPSTIGKPVSANAMQQPPGYSASHGTSPEHPGITSGGRSGSGDSKNAFEASPTAVGQNEPFVQPYTDPTAKPRIPQPVTSDKNSDASNPVPAVTSASPPPAPASRPNSSEKNNPAVSKVPDHLVSIPITTITTTTTTTSTTTTTLVIAPLAQESQKAPTQDVNASKTRRSNTGPSQPLKRSGESDQAAPLSVSSGDRENASASAKDLPRKNEPDVQVPDTSDPSTVAGVLPPAQNHNDPNPGISQLFISIFLAHTLAAPVTPVPLAQQPQPRKTPTQKVNTTSTTTDPRANTGTSAPPSGFDHAAASGGGTSDSRNAPDSSSTTIRKNEPIVQTPYPSKPAGGPWMPQFVTSAPKSDGSSSELVARAPIPPPATQYNRRDEKKPNYPFDPLFPGTTKAEDQSHAGSGSIVIPTSTPISQPTGRQQRRTKSTPASTPQHPGLSHATTGQFSSSKAAPQPSSNPTRPTAPQYSILTKTTVLNSGSKQAKPKGNIFQTTPPASQSSGMEGQRIAGTSSGDIPPPPPPPPPPGPLPVGGHTGIPSQPPAPAGIPETGSRKDLLASIRGAGNNRLRQIPRGELPGSPPRAATTSGMGGQRVAGTSSGDILPPPPPPPPPPPGPPPMGGSTGVPSRKPAGLPDAGKHTPSQTPRKERSGLPPRATAAATSGGGNPAAATTSPDAGTAALLAAALRRRRDKNSDSDEEVKEKKPWAVPFAPP